ncbi:MAG: hypothetical protein FWH21_00530 [Kiritimatiellaeota bacterium]|nr:hypothetical protein [Kiritimatiellota bacterium]
MPDFKGDEGYLLTYRVAEALGWSAERVQDEMTSDELMGWGVYLNTIFSRSLQEDLRTGWLICAIRGMLSKPGHTPKLKDCLPPTQQMMREFFADSRAADPVGQKVVFGAALEQAKRNTKERERLWREGKVMRNGLYFGEVCDKPVGPDADWHRMGELVKEAGVRR